MTTTQTIDGVPLLPCPFCGGEPYGTHDHYVHDDLSPMPCVECRSCSAHLKADDWNRRVQQGSPATSDWERGLEDADGNELVTVRADEYARLKAAQPQGEPVAQKYDDTLLPFVSLMRRELHANAGKGDRPGWLAMSSDTCLLEIIYHFGKLQKAVKKGDGDGMSEYGADVANLCMMLLDICGAINLVQQAEQPAPVAAAQTCCGSCPGGCVYGLKA